MFEVIRQAMSLPDLPPTPPVTALPLDGGELPITTKPLPEIPAELEPQGYLTLAQIQDHMAHDALVGWAWQPGAGRAPAPGTQAELGALVQARIDTGAECPVEEVKP